MAKSFRQFTNWIADTVEWGVDKIVDSRVIPKTVGKAVHLGDKAVGGAVNIGLKGGAIGAKTALFVSEHTDDIKNIGKATYEGGKNFAIGTAKAAQKTAKGVDTVMQKTHMWKAVDFDDSMVKRKMTRTGKFVVGGGALMAGMAVGTKNQVINRQGNNDGRLYRPTPAMTNPYELSSQIAHSQMGNAYANNAGATGDLVFALHNNRHR